MAQDRKDGAAPVQTGSARRSWQAPALRTAEAQLGAGALVNLSEEPFFDLGPAS